jgi:hypothetical protein
MPDIGKVPNTKFSKLFPGIISLVGSIPGALKVYNPEVAITNAINFMVNTDWATLD